MLKTTDSDSLKGEISTLSDEYLAAILYLLNKELGCHVILENYQVPDGASRYANFDLVKRIYSDLELVKYIKNNEIKALSVISFRNNSQTRSNESLDVCENNSSYNFAGISLFSRLLPILLTKRVFLLPVVFLPLQVLMKCALLIRFLTMN